MWKSFSLLSLALTTASTSVSRISLEVLVFAAVRTLGEKFKYIDLKRLDPVHSQVGVELPEPFEH
jgi:hypothetical protein